MSTVYTDIAYSILKNTFSTGVQKHRKPIVSSKLGFDALSKIYWEDVKRSLAPKGKLDEKTAHDYSKAVTVAAYSSAEKKDIVEIAYSLAKSGEISGVGDALMVAMHSIGSKAGLSKEEVFKKLSHVISAAGGVEGLRRMFKRWRRQIKCYIDWAVRNAVEWLYQKVLKE